MAIGRITGSVLKSNLTRNGTDLAFETNLLYLDVTNSRVGIGTSEPTTALQVNGTATATTVNAGSVITNVISSDDSSAVQVSDNLIPSADNTYSLGTPDKLWSALHVSGGTIYIGDIALSSEGTGNNARLKTKVKKTGKGPSDINIDTDYDDQNIVVSDFASGVVDTDLSSVSASDDTLASAKAIKAYVDQISTSAISEGNSDVTVTDTGTGTIGITTDGTNIINFSTALAIDASNSNTAFRLPGGTTGQRPAGAVGMIRYNSSTDKIEGYTTAEGWAEFGAGASSGSEESGDSVIGIGPNPKNITTFTTGTYDSAFFYAILRDESNDEVSTARYSLVHNDTGAFVATSHVNESDTANDYMTVDADITDGVVRLRGTGTSNINSVSYYEIPLGDNTEAGTTGNVTKFINTDVDSASEVIDSFALSSIRGAKYFISTKDDVSGEVSNTEAIVVHDGSTAYITQYGTVNATDNNRDLLTLTVEVDSTVVLVKASSSIANVKVTGYRIALGDSESADTGDSVNIVAATTVNSGATAIDTFASDVYTGAFYVVVGYNSTEGAASISEVSLVTNGGVSYVSTGPVLSTKGTDQLSFTTGVSGTTVTLNAASTSGSSTTVNAYRVHMLRGIGGAVTDTVTVSENETISGVKTFTAPLTLTVGSDPSTVANNAHIYAKDEASSAEVFVKDEAGNVTKISPHNEQGEWEYYSRNVKTGKTVRINMEEMIRDIEKLTGKSYIKKD